MQLVHSLDMPAPEVLFKEGYLTKRAMKSGRNWKRRFFVLENKKLCYFERFGSATLKGIFAILPTTTVHLYTEFEQRPHCLILHIPESDPIFIEAETESEMYGWLDVLGCAIRLADHGPTGLRVPPVCTRFVEGNLFMTDAKARSWSQRWFEVNGPELR
jgi:hypothetical protein